MKSFSQASRARGFTLVEALVALVVLSIGLLGVAALQLTSLRANTSASSRSQATFLAYDITDRMRANRTAAINDAYNIDFGEETATSPTTVAEKDLQDWIERVKGALGVNAQVQVEKLGASSLGTAMVVVRLRWDDTHGDTLNTGGGMSTETGDVTFEMRARI
jgi:type IV pilus assembly protein PilV